MFAFLKDELLVFVDYSLRRVGDGLHGVYVKLDLTTDALQMLIVEVSAVAEALDCSLESEEIDFVEAETAL